MLGGGIYAADSALGTGMFDGSSWEEKLENIGDLAGSLAGGAIGGAAGAGIGSLATGLGGSYIGGKIGEKIGKYVGKAVDLFTSGSEEKAVSSMKDLIMSGKITPEQLLSTVNSEEDADSLISILTQIKDEVSSQD